MVKRKQVFIIGLDEFNLQKLQNLPQAPDYLFLPALYTSEMRNVKEYDIKKFIDLCFQRIEEHGSIDAIASYYDFPGSLLVPVIAQKYKVPGPSLESIMKCENKYWSRLEQGKVISEHIPLFKAFDPFDEKAYDSLGLLPPFWIKPIKAFRSFLAYHINGEAQFYEIMKEMQRDINFIIQPFQEFMRIYNLPAEFTSMKENCIAESAISGHQCTLEGYVYCGRVVSYGLVDSIREANCPSFARYEYPSSLPQEIQFRMADIARRIITQIGLDNCAFNIEFFYDQTADEVYLLEINPRISQSHGDIFEKVHGASHHSIMLDLATGKKPKTLNNSGNYNKAANFMLRIFERGRVKKAPLEEEINRVKETIPGLEITLKVTEGMHLSDLQNQDSYSFELANIFIGGRDQQDLVEKYEKVIEDLSFEIEYDEKVHLH